MVSWYHSVSRHWNTHKTIGPIVLALADTFWFIATVDGSARLLHLALRNTRTLVLGVVVRVVEALSAELLFKLVKHCEE